MLTPKLTEICRGRAHAFVFVESGVPECLTFREWAVRRGAIAAPRRRVRLAPRSRKASADE